MHLIYEPLTRFIVTRSQQRHGILVKRVTFFDLVCTWTFISIINTTHKTQSLILCENISPCSHLFYYYYYYKLLFVHGTESSLFCLSSV